MGCCRSRPSCTFVYPPTINPRVTASLANLDETDVLTPAVYIFYRAAAAAARAPPPPVIWRVEEDLYARKQGFGGAFGADAGCHSGGRIRVVDVAVRAGGPAGNY